MSIDPFSLACNIMAVIDFSHGVLHEALEIYKGATAEDGPRIEPEKTLSEITKNLQECLGKLPQERDELNGLLKNAADDVLKVTGKLHDLQRKIGGDSKTSVPVTHGASSPGVINSSNATPGRSKFKSKFYLLKLRVSKKIGFSKSAASKSAWSSSSSTTGAANLTTSTTISLTNLAHTPSASGAALISTGSSSPLPLSGNAPGPVVSHIGQAFRSLVVAVHNSWHHEEIEKLEKAIMECQMTMQTVILVKMHNSHEAERLMRDEQFHQLNKQLQAFINEVAKKENGMVDPATYTTFKTEVFEELQRVGKETQTITRKLGEQSHNEHMDIRGDLNRMQVENETYHHTTQIRKEAEDQSVQITKLKTSLRHSGLNERYNNIRNAHEQTFQWLFGEAPDQDSSAERDNEKDLFGDFKDWFHDSSGSDRSALYWISGKPGAGKSALMKFLCQRLEEKKILVIRHFFFLGTERQQSERNDLKGMLGSLLHQLLSLDMLVRQVCEEEFKPVGGWLLQQNCKLRNKEMYSDWGVEELEEVTKDTLEYVAKSRPVVVLLDGLDEHLPVADHHTLLQMIKDLNRIPHVRFVVSSRREAIFERRLARARQLRVEALTAADINHFISETLHSHWTTDEGSSLSSDQIRDLAYLITSQAGGVFLWARLAVKDVVQGFGDGNTWDELRQRVRNMPPDISDWIKSIWERLGHNKKRYQQVAANIFALVLDPGSFDPQREMRNHSTPTILTLSLALSPDVSRQIIKCTNEQPFRGTDLLDLCAQTWATIVSHCAGLLEWCPPGVYGSNPATISELDDCVDWDADLPNPNRAVQFIHRSAVDFLQDNPDGQQIVKANLLGDQGTVFRWELAKLSRFVTFREPDHNHRSCHLTLYDESWTYFFEHVAIGWLSDGVYPRRFGLSLEQSFEFLDLCKEVYHRMPRSWVDARLLGRSQFGPKVYECVVYVPPFLVIAAYHLHTDYLVHCIGRHDTRPSSQTWDLILKSHLVGGMVHFAKSSSREPAKMANELETILAQHDKLITAGASRYKRNSESISSEIQSFRLQAPAAYLLVDPKRSNSLVPMLGMDSCRFKICTSRIVLEMMVCLMQFIVSCDLGDGSSVWEHEVGLVSLLIGLLDKVDSDWFRPDERLVWALPFNIYKSSRCVPHREPLFSIFGILSNYECPQGCLVLDSSVLWAVQWLVSLVIISGNKEEGVWIRQGGKISEFFERHRELTAADSGRPRLLLLTDRPSVLTTPILPGPVRPGMMPMFKIPTSSAASEIENNLDLCILPCKMAPLAAISDTPTTDCKSQEKRWAAWWDSIAEAPFEALRNRIAAAWEDPAAQQIQGEDRAADLDELMVSNGAWYSEEELKLFAAASNTLASSKDAKSPDPWGTAREERYFKGP